MVLCPRSAVGRSAWAACILLASFVHGAIGDAAPTEAAWQSIFDGHDLAGWVPKINHHRLGMNAHDTFVAKDGVLHISYDKYDRFHDEFAHLIYKTPLSNYRLRLDYRFVGDDTPGGPPWSKRNSGVMILGQSPVSIGLDQPFPVSIEIQLLNGTPTEAKTTGNVCSPGTNISIDGVLITKHCVVSASRPYAGEAWVHLEVEVRGSDTVLVEVDGIPVMRFDKPQLDPTDLRAMELYLAQPGRSLALESGYISLQGEGHPIDFRNIEIRPLSHER